MRWAYPSLLAGLAVGALVGCDSLGRAPKYDNPVLGPKPPRVSFGEDARNAADGVKTADADGTTSPAAAPTDAPSQIRPVGLTLNGLSPNLPLADSQTVAVVNGRPVLAIEVLEPYAPQLAKAKEKLPPDEYNRARLELIRRDLPSHIERNLLAQALRTTLKSEQATMLDSALDQAFDQEIARMMKEGGLHSRVELEQRLHAEGTSLASFRASFEARQLAIEYIRAKAPVNLQLSRPELLAYYESHKKDYLNPAEARWQQIVVDVRKHGGEAAAEGRLAEIIEKLRPTRGANFAEVAREYSDGPNAEKGGQWEWTKKGSLADADVDRALFGLPVGQPSQVFAKDGEFKIVLVTERRDANHTPFEEVQDEIREQIEREARKNSAREVVEKLKAEADIVTIFDPERETTQASAESAEPSDPNENPFQSLVQ
jgi:parvulin-like peptidyl-prolyl isomerase